MAGTDLRSSSARRLKIPLHTFLCVPFRDVNTNNTLPHGFVFSICACLHYFQNISPLIVSGIVTYEIIDSRRAAIDVPSAHTYVSTQAPAVLKRVISQFPYDSDDSNIPCLRKEPLAVSALMKESLQDRVRIAGVRIESFAINELSYAPEIAHSMLRRQQAGALIEARQVCCFHLSAQCPDSQPKIISNLGRYFHFHKFI
jgi:hypothetical protein